MIFETSDGPLSFEPAEVIVAGWTGRDRAAVEHHIEELAAIGVAPPSEVPLFYRCSPNLLTQEVEISVLGPDTSGEAEPLLVRNAGRTWLGLASDQTDRALETHSVAHSKQTCPKPIATHLWDFESLTDHLERIELRSWILEGGDWKPYQEGTLASILPLGELAGAGGLEDGTAMLCGTLPAIGGVRPAENFRMAIHDPVLELTIEHSYRARVLPVVA